MFKIIAVTNRQLCEENFLIRIEKLVKAEVEVIILREKYLTPPKYKSLLKSVFDLTNGTKTKLIAHSFINEALEIGVENIHLPLSLMKKNNLSKGGFKKIGVSVHSLAEAITSEKLNADYLIYGHIFSSDCKKGIPPKGIDLLSTLKKESRLPIYAIGGINVKTIKEAYLSGADGACLMSHFMLTPNPKQYLNDLKSILEN